MPGVSLLLTAAHCCFLLVERLLCLSIANLVVTNSRTPPHHLLHSVCRDSRGSEGGTPNGDALLSTWSASASWQLLTGHSNGSLLLWDIGGDGITPLVYIDGGCRECVCVRTLLHSALVRSLLVRSLFGRVCCVDLTHAVVAPPLDANSTHTPEQIQQAPGGATSPPSP